MLYFAESILAALSNTSIICGIPVSTESLSVLYLYVQDMKNISEATISRWWL